MPTIVHSSLPLVPRPHLRFKLPNLRPPPDGQREDGDIHLPARDARGVLLLAIDKKDKELAVSDLL
jgi:hypothetical protein